MKVSHLTKLVGAGVIAASLTIVPLRASAQTQSPAGTETSPTDTLTAPTTGTSGTGDVADTDTDNDFDWGWLGLIGLAGLAGLAGKKRDDRPVQYQDPNAARTGYRDPNVTTRTDYRE